VITCVCNYWQLVGTGNPVSKEHFQADVTALLGAAKEQAAGDPMLARDYGKIERPLIFFIDYLVKEGKFPFRKDWHELARGYNELSGDEKFFILLDEALDDPEAGNALVLYYLMLGLGFDGVYRSAPDYIEKCMNRCRQGSPPNLDPRREPLLTLGPRKKTPPAVPKTPFTRRNAILGAVLFLVLCFAVNFHVFVKITRSYRDILTTAATDAVPEAAVTLYPPPVPVTDTVVPVADTAVPVTDTAVPVTDTAPEEAP
jgi:type VI protein secretion system component VasF